MSLKAILIRVGIDQTDGQWNAPCNPETNNFVYVPISQIKTLNAIGLEKRYIDLILPALSRFSNENKVNVNLPEHLIDKRMHLDPDFNHLSYGDTERRGRQLLSFNEDDVLIFYSGYRSIYASDRLIYALMGMLVVKTIERVGNITSNFDENAHTRYLHRDDTDIVVKGKSNISGRFDKCIPIGEFRNRSYRVKTNLLQEWGNLEVNEGWIQRSANPPMFKQPEKFLSWLENKKPKLIAANN